MPVAHPVPLVRVFVLAFFLAGSACAQPGGTPVAKPSASGDDGARQRRADSVLVQPDAAPAGGIQTDTLRLAVGETPVLVLVHTAPGRGDGPGLDALNVHDDEGTSVEAALDVIGRRGGRVTEIQHGGERLLTFRLGGEAFVADPNRIFTEAGRARTLAGLSHDTPAARRALAVFADTLLALYTVTGPDPVVTLHNNTEANYSAASYRAGGSEAAEAAALALPDGADPDDFFFVTDRGLYDALAASGFAVVLQDNARATDDGSLSVWAAQNGARYVNAEAQHGHRAAQTRMLDALLDALATGH